jgi:hypothetical protein
MAERTYGADLDQGFPVGMERPEQIHHRLLIGEMP